MRQKVTGLDLAPDVAALGARFAPGDDGPGVGVTFFGTNCLLVDDGRTRLMIDPHFSRWPGLLGPRFLVTRLRPDQEAVARWLASAGVTGLAAVLLTHAHYDHALDAPLTAELTGAVLAGTASAANVGRGWGLAEDRLVVAEPGHGLTWGDFAVTFYPGAHLPFPWYLAWLLRPGRTIDRPLRPPARATRYVDGGVQSILVSHPGGTFLNQGSAGIRPGSLAGVTADTVLLGVGGLDLHRPAYWEHYFQASVVGLGARRVLLTHWDDFCKPLEKPVTFLRGVARVVDFFLPPGRRCLVSGTGRREGSP
jgi:L-ascorbate metabolism protein UlaG (beta-lactamase superfamily)